MRDFTTQHALAALLAARGLPAHVEVHDTLPSTNTALREQALAGAPHGTLLVAKSQSAGKGSRGRSFCSPTGGLYLSVLLREYTNPMQITCAAAVAAQTAIATVLGISTQIKWVNDLYHRGRKVCGVLCEGVTVGSTLTGVVLGIGINLTEPVGGFPPELATIAGALSQAPVDANTYHMLIVELLANLYTYLADTDAAYMHAYRNCNLVLGRTVCYHAAETAAEAQVLDITPDGGLLLQFADGTTRTAIYGEVALL